MPGKIEERFRENLDRVKGLVDYYSSVVGGAQGRASTVESDLLRAAVVFLHATLEDLLRSVAEERYPQAKPEVLGQFPLAGSRDSRKTTFTLRELAAFRDQAVAEVLDQSIAAALERMSFNNVGDIVRLLEETGLPKSLIDRYRKRIAALMSRRHIIAHSADRDRRSGKGRHPVNSIAKSVVDKWINSVENLGTAILRHL